MQRPGCTVHDIDKHRHTTRKVPQDMTVEEPDSRIVGPEPKHCMAPSRDMHCIAKDSLGVIVRRRLVTWIPRIVRAHPCIRLVQRHHVKVMAVLELLAKRAYTGECFPIHTM